MGGGNPSSNTIGSWGTPGAQSFDNIPSGRYRPANWTDKNGNLWLFGGFGYDSNDRTSYLDDLWEFTPSSNQWTWVGGLTAAPQCGVVNCGQPGNYGQQGIAAPTNVPGARYGSSSWTDAAGKLWLFGGFGFDANNTNSELNDLWSFQPSTNQWTWISGSNMATGCLSIPLEFAVCSGAPPTFGTQNVPASGNNPGAREGANTWVDSSGNVWLYGGMTYYVDATKSYAAQYYLNDLWKLNPSTNQWMWVSGNNLFSGSACYGNANSYLPICGHAGVYGVQGTAATPNTPGGRRGATTWTDTSGNLWLFGGYGFDTNAAAGQMQDMWEFIPSSGQWIWKGGSNIVASCDAALFYDPCGTDSTAGGVYGTQGVPAAGNVPQFTSEAPGWTDKNGNFWMFSGGLSDALWEFSPSANEWTWITGTKGSSLISEVNPVFGIRGTPSPGNSPGGRNGTAMWTGKDGNLWLWGGNSAPFGSLSATVRSDLWEFRPSAPAPVPSFSLTSSVTSLSVAAGSSATTSIIATTGGGFNSSIALSATGQPAGVTISFSPSSINGAGSSAATISTSSSVVPGSYSIIISGSSGNLTQSTTIALVIAPPPPTFTLSESLSSLTVTHGASGTVTLTVTPQFGFNNAVTFACSGLPVGASCSFNPATITPAGGPTTTVTTISVPVTAAAASAPSAGKLIPIGALCFTLMFLPLRRRASLRCIYFVFVLILAGLISSCGGGSGGGSSGSTGPTTHSYTVTITASSGSIQQAGTLTLTVN